MPTLSHHQSNRFTKLLIMGDSGSGKTGALASLVNVGYKLVIWDYDNGLEALKQYIIKNSPERLDTVEYRTLRDRRKASALGPVLVGPPRAFVDGLKLLDRWKYKDDSGTEIDLGDPGEFGEDTICVFDSLTLMCDSAMEWAEPLVTPGKSGEVYRPSIYGMAQEAIGKFI